MASMSPLPPHPYSGYVPQASSSTGSLRLPHDLANRSRSNTLSSLSRGSTPVPIASASNSRTPVPGDLYHAPDLSNRREPWASTPPPLQHVHSQSSGAWVPPTSLRSFDTAMSRSGSMDANAMRAMSEDTHQRLRIRDEPIRRAANGSTDVPKPSHHHASSQQSLEHHRHQKSSNSSTSSPNVIGIAKYILAESEHSKDGGDTLDLSRRGIRVIEAEDVVMLRTAVGKDRLGVWRLALSYNRLTANSFDSSFNTLTRLRYLNLKGNRLAAIPQVLLELPSLEILDVSKNELVELPEDPGRLVQLRVFALSYNKLRKLPGYFVHFANLKVLVVEHNPIEWPPPEVLDHKPDAIDLRSGSKGSTDSTATQKKDDQLWIATIKDWMRTHEQEQVRLMAESLRNLDEPATPHSPSTTRSRSKHSLSSTAEDNESSSLPWLRSASLDRSHSIDSNNLPNLPLSPPPAIRSEPHLGSTKRRRANTTRGDPESAVTPVSSEDDPSPSMSLASIDPKAEGLVTLARNVSSSSTLKDGKSGTGHTRGASYTTSQRSSTNLSSKKSLPDLRLSHAQILADRRSIELESNRDSLTPTRPMLVDPFSQAGDLAKTPQRKPLEDRPENGVSDRRPSAAEISIAEATKEGRSVDQSRNSYFKRLSTLPVSTVAKAIPAALLSCMEGIRGLLFAMSQIHTSLQQYLAFATDDRVASVFARVLDPAAGYLNNLISALDRFDVVSRRRTPPGSVIRPIVESCRDSIAVFAKVMGVLKLQVTALKSSADVRYTRTMFLMVYGSFGEIVHSWQSLAPTLSEIKVLLREPSNGGWHRPGPSYSGSLRTPISPIPERGESGSPSSNSIKAKLAMSPVTATMDLVAKGSPLRPMGNGREKSRRHAGSFSAEDVQTGMMLGPDGVSSATSSDSGSRDMPIISRKHSHLRQESSASQVILEANEEDEDDDEGSISMPPIKSTSREGSFARHGPSSSAGSLKSFGAIRSHLRREGYLDGNPSTPRSAATVVDEGVLDTLEQASDIAYTVWLRLSEELRDPPQDQQTSTPGRLGLAKLNTSISSPGHGGASSQPRSERVIELLARIAMAEETTRHLHESLMEVRAGAHSGGYAYTTTPGSAETRLPSNAQSFIKAVVRVSELAILVSKERPLPINVRSLLAKLTSKTRECGILLQVSTLKPVSAGGNAPLPSAGLGGSGLRPYSPAFGL